MAKADDEGNTSLQAGARETKLPPFPVEALDLPDEDLVTTLWAWWCAYVAGTKGISVELVTPEIGEAIRLASLGMDTDNPAMAALEKILRRIAADIPGSSAKTAEMIRAHFLNSALHIAALDEATTGRRRQRDNSRKPRPDRLQSIILEIMTNKPAVTLAELIVQLRRYPIGDVIDGIKDEDETIDWHDEHKLRSTPFSALKHRMSRARKIIASR
jgi:hypothetical protein